MISNFHDTEYFDMAINSQKKGFFIKPVNFDSCKK